MKKLVLFVLLLPALALAQSGAFGHGGSSLDLSTLLPIIADSTDWTAGSHVHAIKPKDGKTIEADSAKFGALHVTGITTLDGTLNMVTTAGEQVKLGTGSDAAPELSSVGDPNTGVRFPGSDVTTFVQGGAEMARINVGEMDLGTSTDNAKMTVGLTIDQAANDDEAFVLKSSGDVAHGITTQTETNTYFLIKKQSGSDGGALLWGIADSQYGPGIEFRGTATGGSTTFPYITYRASKKSTTTHIACGDGENMFNWMNYTTTLATMLGNGYTGFGVVTPGARVEIAGSKSADTLFSVYNDVTGLTARDSATVVLPDGGLVTANLKIGASNFTTTKVDTIFTAGYIPRWVQFTSAGKTWLSPVYAAADTTGKW